MHRLAVRFIVLLACAASAPSLAATVTDPATLREIGREAALIVRGVVTDVRVVSTGRTIESVAAVAVEHVLKGEADAFVYVRVPGGVAGGRRHVVIGAPTLRAGQQAVFFLARDRENGWRPVGLAAGVVPIGTEPHTGRRVVAPVVAPGSNTATGPVVRGDLARRNLDIGEFESLVALMLASPPPRRHSSAAPPTERHRRPVR